MAAYVFNEGKAASRRWMGSPAKKLEALPCQLELQLTLQPELNNARQH